MNKPVILTLVLSSYLLCACVSPTLVVGQTSEAIASEDVVIYYVDRPHCDFETIAHIRITGGYFSLEAMFKNMRREAARVGASGLYVLHTQQLDVREFLGTAKAIRCLPV